MIFHAIICIISAGVEPILLQHSTKVITLCSTYVYHFQRASNLRYVELGRTIGGQMQPW